MILGLIVLTLKLQEAIKCMRHSKRTMLMTDDVDSALNLRNVEVNIYVEKLNSILLHCMCYGYVLWSGYRGNSDT